MAMYTAVQVANYFIAKAIDSKKPITPMKLQKLVYFAHGWHWATEKEPLIDESIEAWKFGPVVPSIYHKFRYYGNNDIIKPAVDIFGKIPIVTAPDTLEILDLVWEFYSDLSPIHLSNLTHESGSPWYITLKEFLDKGRELPKGKDINDEVIAAYFTQKLENVGA